MAGLEQDEPQRLRQLAHDLRESARGAAWPGYAEKLIEAAEQVERRAVEVEGSVFLKKRPLR